MGIAKNGQAERRSKSKERGSDSSKRKLSFGDYRFARIELKSDEKQQYREDSAAGDWVHPEMDEYLKVGYTVKYSQDKHGHGVICTLTCTDVDSGDAGLQLTGRGSTATVAWDVCSYKDRVVCGERTWKEAENERGGSYDDIG